MIEADPSGRFVLAADLGLDQILVWKFDEANGALTPNDPPSVALPSGDGPRHFAFHPKGRWFYSLQEEASTVVTFDYDAANGRLRAKQTISTLPRGFAGTNFTSEIAVSPDARFVYVANRLHDSIAWFAIGGDGTLTWGGEEWTRGDYPRSFTIDPTGRFLFSCNQRSDAIVVFPDRCEVRPPDVHGPVHRGRLAGAPRLSRLTGVKSQAPKSQAPTHSQLPTPKPTTRTAKIGTTLLRLVWDLAVGRGLGFGAWDSD